MLSTGRGVQLFWQADSPIRQKCLKLSDSSGFQCDSENPVFPDSLRFKFLKTVIRRSLSKGSCQQSTPYNRAVLWHSIPYDMLPSCLHPSSSYTGLCWDGVNFLHGTSCGAVSQISESTGNMLFHYLSYGWVRYAQCIGLLFLTLPSQKVEWGVLKRLRGDTTRQMPELSRDILYHIVPLSAIKKESGMEVGYRNQHSFYTGTGWTGGSNYLCITCVLFYLSFFYFFFTY